MITINLSYYNQSVILRQHVECWNKYPIDVKKQFKFIIVDDCSSSSALEALKDVKHDLDLHIYRVTQDLYCNISGARNLGAQQCTTDWMILLDMDTLIPVVTAKAILHWANENAENNFVLKFNRIVPDHPGHIKNNQFHPAVCLIRLKDYWNIGGCDEDLVGHYGHTDPLFWHRSTGKISIYYARDLYLHYIPEGESDIVRDTTHNRLLFEKKKQLNDWSTDHIRFDWEQMI